MSVDVSRETAEELLEAGEFVLAEVQNGRYYGNDREETRSNAEDLSVAIDELREALREESRADAQCRALFGEFRGEPIGREGDR